MEKRGNYTPIPTTRPSDKAEVRFATAVNPARIIDSSSKTQRDWASPDYRQTAKTKAGMLYTERLLELATANTHNLGREKHVYI